MAEQEGSVGFGHQAQGEPRSGPSRGSSGRSAPASFDRAGRPRLWRHPGLEAKLKEIEAKGEDGGKAGTRGGHRRHGRNRRLALDRGSSRQDARGVKDKLLRMEDGTRQSGWSARRRRCARSPPPCSARAGLRDRTGRSGSFMFLGPTGVSKTESGQGARGVSSSTTIGRWCASACRIHGEALGRPADQRPPGYTSATRRAALTSSAAPRPIQVVLFDEVEAHGDVINVLLQVLDDGQLTDGQGRTVDFRNDIDAHLEHRGRVPGQVGELGGVDERATTSWRWFGPTSAEF